MPQTMSDSLNMLTSYLRDENARMEQKIKEKQLDVLLNNASDKFASLGKDASTDDARNAYFEAMQVAGQLEVGKDAMPFLNQMLSSSVAFIKENEAKRLDAGFVNALNSQFGTKFNPKTMTGEGAAQVLGLDLQSQKPLELVNEEGQHLWQMSRLRDGQYQLTGEPIMINPQTDTYRMEQYKQKLQLEKKYSPKQSFASDRPNLTTFVGDIDGTKLPLSYQSGKFYYSDPKTGELIRYSGDFFDQKTASTTERNTTRNELESITSSSKDIMQGDATSLANMLRDNEIIKKNFLQNPLNKELIKGNESGLYTRATEINNVIKSSDLPQGTKDQLTNMLERFTASYESYEENSKRLREMGPTKEADNSPKYDTEDAEILNEITNSLKGSNSNDPMFKAISMYIKSKRPNHNFLSNKSYYGYWNGSGTLSLSEEEKYSLIKTIKEKRKKDKGK